VGGVAAGQHPDAQADRERDQHRRPGQDRHRDVGVDAGQHTGGATATMNIVKKLMYWVFCRSSSVNVLTL
jgi:hypothetical protein